MTITSTDPWLLPFLRKISRRPGAYLGDETVRTLATYLLAYSFARTDLGFPEFGVGEETLLRDFHQWLEGRLKVHSTLGWRSIIEKVDSSERSVHTFIKLFDEFLESTGRESLAAKGPST
jgi:hypothetical protein